MHSFGAMRLALLLVVGSVAGLNDFWNDLRLETDVTEKINQFSFELASVAFADPHGVSRDENAVISPINVWVVLSMLAAGAEGNTKRELESALRWSNTHNERRGLSKLVAKFKKIKSELSMITEIGHQKKLKIKSSYKDGGKHIGQANWKSYDFSTIEETRKQINRNIEQESHGHFVDFMPTAKFNASTSLFLIGGSYFKNSWMIPGVSVPELKPFHTFSGAVKNVRNVRYTGIIATGFLYPYFQSHVFRLSHETNNEFPEDFHTYMIVPFEQGLNHFNEIEKNLHSMNFDYLRAPYKKELNLYVPKLAKVESTMCLERSLRKLNVSSMWNKHTADFSGITDDKETYTSKFYHKSSLVLADSKKSTHHHGSSEPDSTINDFYVDRPFLLVTVAEGAVLFIARIVDPTYV